MEYSLKFYGNEDAEKFSHIVNVSFRDMERNLLVTDKNDPLYGYCYQALPDGWTGFLAKGFPLPTENGFGMFDIEYSVDKPIKITKSKEKTV